MNPLTQSTCGCQSVFNNLRAAGAGLPKPLNRQRLVRAVLPSIQLVLLRFISSTSTSSSTSGYMFLAAMDLPTVQNSLMVSYRFTASLNCCIYKGEKQYD
ncbi:putative protein 70 [Rhizopogon vesiculosus]|uniref:Uncharacterized protein n=1 Tax=Rhizopogon vesiculosus TaxID=180088 RepID=A0A1J8R4E2_9AGAM|nr:putative protein 70 [Rhizopogon vesiculosus]